MSRNISASDEPARILIVDDERSSRRILEVMLKAQGYVPLTASSGQEALTMLAKDPPDLILLDVMMPEMDGYQVTGKIKSNPLTENIPIIMVTALDDREAKMLGLFAGAEDFLTKPVDRAELSARVRNLLRLKAYGDYHDDQSQKLEVEVAARTTELVARTTDLERQTEILEQAHVELRMLTDRLSLATDVAKVGVWEWDLATNVFTSDATMCTIYGFEPLAAMPCQQWAAAVHPDDLPAVDAITRTTIREKDQASAEFRITRPDGSVRNVSAAARAVLDQRGNVSRLIGVNVDVTERKDAERVLEQIRQEEMRFKDEFMSHVSHELRSPLTAIKQFTSILLGGLAGELNKEQREYQEIVLKNIRQLQSMIDDLLEVTRLETGKLTFTPENVSVATAVIDALDTLQGTATAKGVTLSSTLPPDLPYAHADEIRLRQILIILLDNAVKFTPDGGSVVVQVGVQSRDPRFLLLEVLDTGCGINPETSNRIFERLFQVSERNQTSRKGLGLGLYICKELVTRQGGEIWVKRRAQKGTTFSFTLPIFAPVSPAASSDSSEEAVIVDGDEAMINSHIVQTGTYHE